MRLKAGIILKARSLLNGSYFENASVFITEYNENGAIGFVFNKAFGRHLNELEEFRNDKPVPLYAGGPMDTEHIYIIHRRPDLISGCTPITAGLYMAGDIRDAVNGLNTGAITSDQIRLFIGYCGWDAGELEAEVEEGSWEVTDLVVADVFAR